MELKGGNARAEKLTPEQRRVADDELRRRCEDLLAADAHHDRVIRKACVILEDRVRLWY